MRAAAVLVALLNCLLAPGALASRQLAQAPANSSQGEVSAATAAEQSRQRRPARRPPQRVLLPEHSPLSAPAPHGRSTLSAWTAWTSWRAARNL